MLMNCVDPIKPMTLLTWPDISCTELLGLFWTLSLVLYVEDKRPQSLGDWICLRPQVDGAG
jgi:hypothetical protein